MRELNLPWSVEYAEDDWFIPNGAFPWLVLDKWHVVIGRFDREDEARSCVDGVNLIQRALGRL
jgi:hypothetical protein